MEIRKLKPDEIALFQHFLHWNAEEESSPLPSEAYVQQWLGNPQNHAWVAYQKGQLVGGLTAFSLPLYQTENSELFIYEVGVDEAFRQMGLGKALVHACLHFAQEQGYSCAYVGTEPDNGPARKLYQSTGGAEETVSWFVYDFS